MTIRRLARPEAVAAAERAAAALAEDPTVRLVFLFGSAATGPDDRPVRDVDVAVLMDPPPSGDRWRLLIATASRASGRDLDLVPLHRAGVTLAREVADTGRCLFSRTPDDEVEFVVQARSRFLDFRPFLDEQRRLGRERAEERLDGPAP